MYIFFKILRRHPHSVVEMLLKSLTTILNKIKIVIAFTNEPNLNCSDQLYRRQIPGFLNIRKSQYKMADTFYQFQRSKAYLDLPSQ